MVKALILFAALSSIKPMTMEYSMSASRDGKNIGSFVGAMSFKADGSCVDWSCEVSSNRTTTFREWEFFDRNGKILRAKLLKTGFQYRKEVSVEYGNGRAIIKINDNGQTSSQTMSMPSGLPFTNKSLGWFILRTPKPGDQCTFRSLNLYTLQWVTNEKTFIRSEVTDFRGKKVRANLITWNRPETGDRYSWWYDDRGKTYKIILHSPGNETVYTDSTR